MTPVEPVEHDAWKHLQERWETACEFRRGPGAANSSTARRRDNGMVLESATPEDVQSLVRHDYRESPVAREFR